MIFDNTYIRPLGDVPYEDELSVEWVVINLSDNLGSQLEHVRTHSAGLEVFAATALHPNWIKATGNTHVPSVVIGGFEVTTGHSSTPWKHALSHFFLTPRRSGEGEVAIGVAWIDKVLPHEAIPTVTLL